MALARSLDCERDGALSEALAVLMDAFSANVEEEDEAEKLLTDAVRLATRLGDLSTAQALTSWAVAKAADSDIPHCKANALYSRGLLDHDASRLLAAAERTKPPAGPC